ncbi:MAG: hypothetical protein N2049_11670 [Anaerolineales bacterium]|nr:hypothetical protein [Anaerolineales bacterium]MDW8226818.1 hypothetical protein [Anaerolineales bacterium]
MTHSVSPDTAPLHRPSRGRSWLSLFITLFGLLVFLIGIRPGFFGLDRSPVMGFIQIATFTIGLGIISIGGYFGLTGFWKTRNRTIAADIGSRLVATGYVIVVFAAMADIFGFGTQIRPQLPHFGPLQAIGVEIGQVIILIGFLLLIPYGHSKQPPPGA